MGTIDLETLNDKFAIANTLSFRNGAGDLPIAEIKNRYAATTIFLLGGQVTAFQPVNQQPVLWVSQQSFYEKGRAIRGGIPVCWPWFAAHPTDPQKPSHGFVRTRLWSVDETGVTGSGATQICLSLSDDESTQLLWPYPFRLRLVVTVGPELRVELVVQNPGSSAFSYTGALHSYFSISDVANVTITGLEDGDYLDKVEQFRRKTQQGPITIEAETDRIYLETEADCVIQDKGWARSIQMAKIGSRTTVIWNPWQERARQLPDLADQEYRDMVCVETVNTVDDIVTVPPGGEGRLSAVISVR